LKTVPFVIAPDFQLDLTGTGENHHPLQIVDGAQGLTIRSQQQIASAKAGNRGRSGKLDRDNSNCPGLTGVPDQIRCQLLPLGCNPEERSLDLAGAD
jgi:hypothetical protein